MCVCVLNCVWLFATPLTVAHQALLYPWNFPGKNTGKGCYFLFQVRSRYKAANFPTQQLEHWHPVMISILAILGKEGATYKGRAWAPHQSWVWPVSLENCVAVHAGVECNEQTPGFSGRGTAFVQCLSMYTNPGTLLCLIISASDTLKSYTKTEVLRLHLRLQHS